MANAPRPQPQPPQPQRASAGLVVLTATAPASRSAIKARLMGSPPWFVILLVPRHRPYSAERLPAISVSSGPSLPHRKRKCLPPSGLLAGASRSLYNECSVGGRPSISKATSEVIP